MGIIGWIFTGLVVGLIARAVVPTKRRYGFLGTVLLGIIGSVVGGTLASVIAGDEFAPKTSGWIGSIVGAIVLLVVIRWNDSGRS